MARQDSGTSEPDASGGTRDRIKSVAAELYVLKGHEGFSFGDIAAVIGTTRANIHHHFGSKQQLMRELIEDIASNAVARIERYWRAGTATFAERLSMQLDDLRRYYERFNRGDGDRNVWSPLSRLRHDLPTLGSEAVAALERVNRTYDACLRHAVEEAAKAGQLRPGTDVDDVVRVLRVMLLACPPMTQDAGRFDEIELLFRALGRMISAAGEPGSGEFQSHRTA
ncbi:TetR/AcrR family transcriptional regulator [Inquilinus limosus]|uniref:TetR/AcrR family transcriptional regulator n=1 Tax=Inquilinus limosus TaxID=171674 RepID=UPI003F160156